MGLIAMDKMVFELLEQNAECIRVEKILELSQHAQSNGRKVTYSNIGAAQRYLKFAGRKRAVQVSSGRGRSPCGEGLRAREDKRVTS